MEKSNLPVSDYSVNPYVGCTHACRYCCASFTLTCIREKRPDLPTPCQDSSIRGSRLCWEALDGTLCAWAQEDGLSYVRNGDSIKRPSGAPPVIVSYFYREEVKKSARKGGGAHA